MNLKLQITCLVISTTAALVLTGCAHKRNPWKEVTQPVPGPSEAIGGYSKGCLKGAISLPSDGPGFHVMRISRRRFYGHQDLIKFLYSLSTQVEKKKLGTLLLGDLSQPRGGPTLSGHVSHQSGLDVDIWFYQPKTKQEIALLDARENLQAPSMLTADSESIDTTRWTKAHEKILELTAKFPEVERIFVNPVIKRHLCSLPWPKKPAKDGTSPKAWLQKIRPWWGHQDHFHVRLKCAATDLRCQTQEAVEEGDGCGEKLETEWFSAEAREVARKMREESKGSPEMPELPEACEELISPN